MVTWPMTSRDHKKVKIVTPLSLAVVVGVVVAIGVVVVAGVVIAVGVVVL